MPLLDALLARLRPRGSVRFSVSDAVRAIEGKSVSKLYSEQPHLRTVVDFLAQNVAQLTPKCYLRNGDADRERDTTGVLPLLLGNPNPDMTAYDLMYSTVADWALYGRAVWLVGRDSKSDSGWQIRPIPPTWMADCQSDGFAPRSFTFANTYGGGRLTVDASQCVVFTAYRPSCPDRALSPVESLRQTLAEQVEAQAFRRSVWDNATRISGFISRPAGVEWSDGAARRFKEDVRGNWGKRGAHAGGTPVLEDGMRYEPVTFSAREGDWAAGVKLSREDVAAAYHINPAVIWPGEGQTYASAKDNARALYADTLMPLLTMLQKRITKTLAPMVGAPENEYVEFDIRAKLQGSFEEQAAAIQSAVGGPWMTREEARAMMNMPREPQGDLITPLNVLVGGMASPTDTAPKLAPLYAPVQAGKARPPRRKGLEGRRSVKAAADKEDVEGIEEVLRGFFQRQRKSVLAAIGASEKAAHDGRPVPDWWDDERWKRELADDLLWAMEKNSKKAGELALKKLGFNPRLFDSKKVRPYLKAWAESVAKGVNDVTYQQLLDALDNALSDTAAGSTPAGVFDKAEAARAEQRARTLASQVANWSTVEAALRHAPVGSKVSKTWRTHHSKNPRKGHARLNGQTVGIDEKFSNGARYPGDWGALKASEVANCHCTVEVSVEGAGAGDFDALYERWESNGHAAADAIAYLHAAASAGDVVYSKPLGAFAGKRDEHDLSAHVALHKAGYRPEVLAEDAPDGYSNIDLLIDGNKWEVKSLESGNIRSVEDNLRKAKRQFAKNYPEPISEARVVINGMWSSLSDDEISDKIDMEMRRHGILHVLQVCKDGRLVEHK